jgi:coproporphyrinogen III oxidase
MNKSRIGAGMIQTDSQIQTMRAKLLELQDALISKLERIDGGSFDRDHWQRPSENPNQSTRTFSGDGRSCILENSSVIERGAVLFSHIAGSSLPAAASTHRPHLTGATYEVVGLSCVIHPRNPFAPTAHFNVRCFQAQPKNGDQIIWFGGGMDLTPHYLFEDDARDFHAAAQNVSPFHYAAWKKTCDEYFWIKHRNESRGIGGIFFDDLTDQNGSRIAVNLIQEFTSVYSQILSRRAPISFSDLERDWQLYRRGRYAEFNLVWDRGTSFGLQSGGRIESILASMPPLAAWKYDHQPTPVSRESELLEVLQNPRDWV